MYQLIITNKADTAIVAIYQHGKKKTLQQTCKELKINRKTATVEYKKVNYIDKYLKS